MRNKNREDTARRRVAGARALGTTLIIFPIAVFGVLIVGASSCQHESPRAEEPDCAAILAEVAARKLSERHPSMDPERVTRHAAQLSATTAKAEIAACLEATNHVQRRLKACVENAKGSSPARACVADLQTADRKLGPTND